MPKIKTKIYTFSLCFMGFSMREMGLVEVRECGRKKTPLVMSREENQYSLLTKTLLIGCFNLISLIGYMLIRRFRVPTPKTIDIKRMLFEFTIQICNMYQVAFEI